MKKLIYMSIVSMLIFTGCASNQDQNLNKVSFSTPVKVMEVVEKTQELTNQYFGFTTLLPALNTVVVSVNLTPQDVKKYGVGSTVQVEQVDQKYSGQIVSIAESFDPKSLLYNVIINMNEPGLKADQMVVVKLEGGELTGIFLPLDRIMYQEKPFVYTVNAGVVEQKDIKLSDIVGYDVLVEGLKPGEKVIIENASKVQVGDPVTIIE